MFAENLLSGVQSGPSLFFISAVVGFAAAVPLGPISILTIQRAMSLGFWRAFWPTLGAVIADGIFGIIAALGSGYLTSAIMGGKFWLKLVGSMLLLVIGAKLLTLRSPEKTVPREDFRPVQLAALNFTLVLSNPLTLAFFLAAFTFLGLDSGRILLQQSLVIGAGVILGTLFWFVLICAVAGIFHRKVNDLFLQRVRFGVGGLFVVLGIFSAITVLFAG